ncbi:DUF2268 domain-containing putative Zn-dependent protease [Evansella sp. AB-rgal1]|uniref:DUF2268 domain-containing putative Zn-dependent protease n=1 Tax=Evansella sp. AB-rgal1 TaxID=3242696 RepID=UPI00359E0EB9
MIINQITPMQIYANKNDLESFFEKEFVPIVSETTWMKEWRHIAQRFRLFTFKEFSKEEVLSFEWECDRVKNIIEDTIFKVKKHIPLEELNITVLPALPFPWFNGLDQSKWTNGFTNGPNSIQIAVPPNPDEAFLRYMIAHEAHHASPINPIYKLSSDSFPLAEWFKMEGTAEYFSLSLFEDKRWWKKDFTDEVKSRYVKHLKGNFDTTDDKIKSPICFGNPDIGIPYLSGYSFAYEVVCNYVKQHPIKELKELFSIQPSELKKSYQSSL